MPASILLKLPCNVHPAVRFPGGSLTTRLDLPAIETPDIVMTISPPNELAFDVSIVDGRLYAPLHRMHLPGYPFVDLEHAFSHYFERHGHYAAAPPESSVAMEVLDPQQSFAIINGIACHRVPEPVWTVSWDFRQEARPPHIKIRLHLDARLPQYLAPSDPPLLIFRADRLQDAIGCARLFQGYSEKSTITPSAITCTVHRAGALKVDDVLATANINAASLVGCGHKILSILRRGGIESWIGLRRWRAGPTATHRDALQFGQAVASFRRHLQTISGDISGEEDKWLRRTQAKTEILLARFSVASEFKATADEPSLYAWN